MPSVGQGWNPARIQLVWPEMGTGLVPIFTEEGQWSLQPDNDTIFLHPLSNLSFEGDASAAEPDALIIAGSRLSAMYTLRHGLRHKIAFAYLDLPRIRVDDQETAFRGERDLSYSTWLTLLETHLRAVAPLIRRTGVVAIHVGDDDAPLARLVADEVLGRSQRIGTIVWQRAYAPQNMKGMKELTATHDCIHLYAVDKHALPVVGLRVAPRGYGNPDEDPRGPWKAEHKGAASRRENSDFDTFLPPYRWELEGQLPPGLWRVSPLTGAIWGTPTEAGEYQFTVTASDSAGAVASRVLTIDVSTTGVPPELPKFPWAFEEIQTDGPLRVTTESLPPAVVDREYATAVAAAGGAPFRGRPRRPGPGRYWEFARATLVSAYQRDAVHLGRTGTAIPHPKAYLSALGESVVENQQTWWPGRVGGEGARSQTFVGHTEDATKHLASLERRGLISMTVKTAKPEPLLQRLLDMFAPEGETVLQVFGDAGDLTAVALKSGRRGIHLAGEGERSDRLVRGLVLPRLRTVAAGADTREALLDGSSRPLRPDAISLTSSQGGSIMTASVGPWLAARKKVEEESTFNVEAYEDAAELRGAVLTAQGFLPETGEAEIDGLALDGRGAAVYLGPRDVLTPERLSRIVSSTLLDHGRLTIYYFRASEDLDLTDVASPVTCRRLPFDLDLSL